MLIHLRFIQLKLLWVVIVLLKCFQHVIAFNLDAKFPTFYKSPFQSNSFFGYSVDYYFDNAESWQV